MIYKYQYNSQEERNNIISANIDKILIEEDNITEGNFLIFSDEIPTNNIPQATLDQRISDLEMAMAAIIGGAEE